MHFEFEVINSNPIPGDIEDITPPEFKNLEVSEDIFNVNDGDKTFNFPIKSLNYYPWLKTLLENNNNVNLTDYLQDTSNENKRYIENCLKILENYYNNQEVLLINDTNLTFTESFLSKGPYSTKGLDLEYQCLKCKKKTFNGASSCRSSAA